MKLSAKQHCSVPFERKSDGGAFMMVYGWLSLEMAFFSKAFFTMTL